jgi:formylglycine-generating enzyme required for sulfatase activity
MPAGYFIAVLLCAGDNCDLVRAEPGIEYPTYEACSAGIAREASHIGEIASRLQAEEGRQGEIGCVRDRLAVAEVDEEHEALASIPVRERPEGAAREIARIERGGKAHVTGVVAGADWVRLELNDGRPGFAYAERLRKVDVSARSPAPAPQPQPSTAPTRAVTGIAPEAPSAGQQATTPTAMPEPPRQSPKEKGAAQEFRDCDRCPTMVALPGGPFQMGSSGDPSERPTHRVLLAPFAIGKFEVTHGEWRACAAAGVCALKPNISAQDRLPMMNVSWEDAAQYAGWLRQLTGKPYRVPTEAEWEYAARAGTSTPFPWGHQAGIARIDCSGCRAEQDGRLPALAGSLPPNPWGIHDMLGGVAEWVEDCWHKTYDGAPANGSAWTAARCTQRVLRGGSWKNPPADVTVSARNFYDASVRYSANGLRVALSLGETR